MPDQSELDAIAELEQHRRATDPRDDESVVKVSELLQKPLPEIMARIDRLTQEAGEKRLEQAPREDDPGDKKLAELEAKRTELLNNIERLMKQIGKPAQCTGCGRAIWFVKHRNGNITPYTAEALNHFIDCPQRDQFPKKAT